MQDEKQRQYREILKNCSIPEMERRAEKYPPYYPISKDPVKQNRVFVLKHWLKDAYV